MDRGDPDRSSSKASSVSGRSQSAKSWNSLPPDERELANELHSQHLRLESRGSNSNSSNTSQPRDKLQAAEAAERDIEARHSQSRSSQQPHSVTASPAVARSAADSGRERQSNARSGSGSSGYKQVRTSEALGSESSSGASKEAQQVAELQAKNQALEAALRSRDAQATQMIADCTDIDSRNQERMTAIESQLADAVKARKKAEDERDAVEVKAAGDKAKSASSLAAANEDRLKLEDRDRKTEARAAEAQVELDAARWDLRQSKQRELVETRHQEKAKELSDNRIEELEGLLSSANRQLALLRRDEPNLGSTASERSLQDQIDLLIEERAQDRKDMSEARLELLGLKKKQAMQAIDQAKSPSELRQAHQAAGGGGGRSRGRGRGRGAGKGMLEIIEEEEGSVGLPARAAESLASECDSSDCGDLDDLTNPDQSAQNDLLNKLLAELTVERKAKQDMRDDHAGQHAEHVEEVAQLQRQLAAAGVLQETTSAENIRLQSIGKEDKIKQLQQVDDLHVKVRELEEALFVEMKVQTDKEEQQEFTNAALQEKIQLQAERNAGTDEMHGQAKDDSPEESLYKRIRELEEERNLLLSKIEVQEVQHQVQLEDAYRDHASRLQEQRVKFEAQIAEIRSRYEQLLRQRPGHGHSEDLLLGLGSWSNVSSLSAEASKEVSSPASQSTGGTAGTSISEKIRCMIWAVLGLVPNAVALQCAFDDLVIQKATARAGAIFSGLDLMGMSFFSLLQDKTNAAVIRRMMLVNQSMADSSQSEIPSFVAATLGRFGLHGISGQVVDGVLSMAHLPADSPRASGPDGRHIILVISEQQQPKRAGGVSVASSDVCPSDSVSVGKRRPQFMTSELQRSKLRASFFEADGRTSAISGHSSPRNSLA
ncbi:gba-3 [Symbiodinium necroappetens]|uniref:Gba-3 protein n=1 Tax=Symbiodinium necroappetens TaxID=1628268 RepID=A0A812QLK7_9DINO|nr:gba-3 [Symbiodinium necroappetens]